MPGCPSCGGDSDRAGACVWCRVKASGRASGNYLHNPDDALKQIRRLCRRWIDHPLSTLEGERLAELVTEMISELDGGGPLPTAWATPRRRPRRLIEDTPPLPGGPEVDGEPPNATPPVV
jgi:hypothetical protein